MRRISRDSLWGGVVPFRFDFDNKNSHANKIIEEFRLTGGQYYNTGVILLDLKHIREEGAQNELIDAIEIYSGDHRITLFDQDIINIVYNGNRRSKIKAIDLRWNQTQTPIKNFRPLSDMFIIHYAGRLKPWNTIQGSAVYEYLRYSKMTSFHKQIKRDILELVELKLEYLNKKLSYKKYLRKKSLFDIKIFGKEIFPHRTAHYQQKINAFLTQKKEKELYGKSLLELRDFLIKD